MTTHSLLKTDSIKDSYYRDCRNKYFHNFKYECIYVIKLTNITINEIVILNISVKSMTLWELNKILIVARQNGFVFIQINKLTINLYSRLRFININLSAKEHAAGLN